jgi:hypothetical protein
MAASSVSQHKYEKNTSLPPVSLGVLALGVR